MNLRAHNGIKAKQICRLAPMDAGSHQSSRGGSNGAMAQRAPLNPEKPEQGEADRLPWKQTQHSKKHFSTQNFISYIFLYEHTSKANSPGLGLL